MKTLKILTFNTAILNIRLPGYTVYRPVDFINQRLLKLIEVLKKIDADIVFLQELFHPRYQMKFCSALTPIYPCAVGLAPTNFSHRLGNELLTLSKYPLSDGRLSRFIHAPSEELRHTSKGYYTCKISIPEYGLIQLVNFHVSAGGKKAHPESIEMENIRSMQIQQILDDIDSNERILLIGDLNAGPDSSKRNYQQVLDADFTDSFLVTNGNGITWDPDNPLVQAGLEAHLPPQRIDHIFLSQSLSEDSGISSSSIVMEDRLIKTKLGVIPLSDHYGVLTVISL